MGQCLCLRRRARVIEPPVELPCELEEEILTYLPPQSLLRFRSICKQWNSLFNDQSFLKHHLSRSRPQFLFLANFKVYSIAIINNGDPKIELLELPSSVFPYEEDMIYTTINTCDEFLFVNYPYWKHGAALWNPWLRQFTWIDCEYEDKTFFHISGLGYDNSRPEKVYKVLGFFFRNVQLRNQERVAVYECASHAFKFIDTPEIPRERNVSLNGNLYWITRNLETGECSIRSFDFSMDKFKPFCLLPCPKNNLLDNEPILAVYKGDRFSLLNECYATRKIEIWVMKKNIDRNEEEVEWINLMTLPTTNLSRLSHKYPRRISYFIYDKTMFLCCGDHIIVVRKDLCKKIQIDRRIVNGYHCVYTPNLISPPSLN